MKKSFILGLLLLNSVAHAQGASPDDMFFQTRVEQRTMSALIDKTRVLLANSEIDDYFTATVDITDDARFTISQMSSDSDYAKFREVFTSVFKLDLTNAAVRVRVPKLSYSIEKLHAKPLAMNVQDPYLTLKVNALISGLTTTLTNGLDLDLMITNPKTGKEESYLTAHLAPTTIVLPNSIEPMGFDVEFVTKRDQQLTYALKSQDLSAVPTYIDRNFPNISIVNSATKAPLSADHLSVNPVTIRLSALSRTVSFDSFKPLLQKRLNKIVASIVSQLGVSIQNKLGPKILNSVFSTGTRSDLIVENEYMYTRFLTKNFSQPTIDQLYLGVAGELCTAETFKQYHEHCDQYGNFPAPIRAISAEDRQKAKTEITENLARGQSDLVLSMSEEYVNRLLYTTIQANLWNEALEGENLGLGPKGAFIVFDQRTKNPELYLDVLYYGEGKGITSALVNERKPIRFPLRISTSLKFEAKDGIPHMIIKTDKIVSSASEIINGIPKYDLPSQLIFGFKKKIAKMILNMSEAVEGKTAVDLDIPTVKNIDLEKSWHEASPFGRLNLFFKL